MVLITRMIPKFPGSARGPPGFSVKSLLFIVEKVDLWRCGLRGGFLCLAELGLRGSGHLLGRGAGRGGTGLLG